MFVHSVYFWLKPELNAEQEARFWAGVKSLGEISSVRFFFTGTPASTDRPIIDRSYSCKLVCGFDDMAGHDFYQEHEIHDRFRDECGDLWNKVLIYDSVSR